ncbi:MAG: LPXTG cell wall anchor domain-containing protein [Bacteroides sp.]|nr:LPXTG cell wall anchor domain-containing protein [Eubacterium sp.]MCM1419045.1 LPXTG cell wall anchor domain-containing protein [Roseburia sp.]MCM1463612.1 LPXTG cell wall anchor domain-containing protein [Bacteroides sp.]
MKLRKILSSVIAGSLAVSAMAISVSADAMDVIDFEDGAFTGISMKTDDGGDKSVLSVVDYNGSKQLKVEVQDKTRSPKVYFDLDEIYGENMTKIASITYTLTLQSKEPNEDEEGTFLPTGWAGGAAGIQATGAGVAWDNGDQWTLEEYVGDSVTGTITRDKISIPTMCDDAHMLIMRWPVASDGSAYDMYIDDVTAKDADGNIVPAYAPAEEATSDEEEATEDETTDEETADDEVADDEAADDEDADADADADEDTDADEDEDADEDTDEDEDADDEEETNDVDVDEDEAPAATEAAETTAPVVETTEAPSAGDVAAATDSSKGSPDTGVADVAAVAGLAIVAAGAVLVSKKRK